MADHDSQNSSDGSPSRVAAVLGRFPTATALKDAAERVREEGYRKWDCHSPFPIHGIERAMGIRPTVLPWLVFGAGLTGATAGMLLQWWTNAVDYPYIISGKPFFSIPADVPVAFELVILFSALTAFGGALILNQLPRFQHPVFESDEFRRATSDGFFVSIEAEDPRFHPQKTASFLESIGATVELCQVPAPMPALPKAVRWVVAFVLVLAFLPPLGVAWYRASTKRIPRIHPLQDMAFQPKYRSQAENDLFPDRRSMRPPVVGTISQDGLALDAAMFQGKDAQGAYVTGFPVPVDQALMLRGRDQFDIYCAPCHGFIGGMPEGIGGDPRKWDGMVTVRASQRALLGDGTWTPPRVLHSPYVQDQPNGKLFETVTKGVNNQGIQTMPSYAKQIPVQDRWAIVLYLRALGRSQNAPETDLPQDQATAKNN
ncbi:MAG: quinol:electron acceptor oxidoreductase subunit ActD [Thermoguttaceae bacterium]